LKIRDKVFVKAAHFHTTQPSKNLSEKVLGPFKIVTKVGHASFTLQLSDQLQAVHPIFHISQLQPATTNTIPNNIQPLPPIEVDDDFKYEISKIFDSKLDKQ
jgi:hypothetical protein